MYKKGVRMEEVKHEKCRRCKCWRADNQFLNDKGRRMKTCGTCRDSRRNILKITKRDMSKPLNEDEGLAIIMKVKEYYEDMQRERKEKANQYGKQYYEENKKRILEKAKEKRDKKTAYQNRKTSSIYRI